MVQITKEDLVEMTERAVSGILLESRKGESASYNGHDIHIECFNMKDPQDRAFIIENLDTIWDILIKGYENIGGFKGFQSKKEIIRKSPIVKLGFYDNEIVAVDVFNGYLGGNKSVGITCVKNDKHEPGVLLVEMIIKENITNFNDWVWCEAAGRVEEIYKKHGGFQVPDKYLEIFLTKTYERTGDGFHYVRRFSGDDEKELSDREKKLRIKSVFGLKNKEIFERMLQDVYGPLLDFVKRLNIGELNEEIVFDSYYKTVPEVEQAKMIVDRCISLVEDDLIYDFPEILYNEFKNKIIYLKNSLKNKTCPAERREHIKECVKMGMKAFSKISVLKVFSIN